MPKVKVVEDKIAGVEKFPRVAFYRNGINVKSDKGEMPQYKYVVAAPSSWTVAEWRSNRFLSAYPGYEVKVYLQNGAEAAGNMKLTTVRGEN